MLSVIIPIYNEAGTLEELVGRVRAVPIDKELILVDDGSTDGTHDVLEKLTGDPDVQIFFQGTNRGKGAAVRRGIRECVGDIVVVQDADLEYDPEEYPKLIKPIHDGKADVVYGSRFAGGESHRVLYFWHYLGNLALTTLSNMLTNLNLTDMETCYKAFRREVLESFTIEEDRFGLEPELTAKVARGGWRIYEVGISYAGRTYAEGKKISWRDGVRALICILKYNLFRR
jgi:glycosyltransferase involved in cell wall biosynthesis